MRGAEDLSRPRGDTLGDLGKLGQRRELLRQRQQCLGALGLAALRVEELGVDDGDGCVRSQHLQQPEVIGVELVEAEF
jgi:hypothetical protein